MVVVRTAAIGNTLKNWNDPRRRKEQENDVGINENQKETENLESGVKKTRTER